MDSVRLMVSQYLRAAWRRRWMGVIVAWLVCGVGWVVVYTIPNLFESGARLFVDADAVLTPLLRGLAADSAPTTQLEILQRTLLSRPNLEKLVSKTDLDLTLNSPSDRERLITRLSNDIKVVPQTKNLFTITYRDKSPKLAHDVVQTLLTIFVESATGGSRADMENARRFLERQIQSYEQQLRGAEKRRADFRGRYIEILPADNNPNVPALEAARNAATALEGRLQDALISRDALKQEVENTPPMLVVESGQFGLPGGPVPRTRLQDAQDQLTMLLLKYTDQHPDVIAQRKLIDSLKNAPREAPGATGTTAAKDAATARVVAANTVKRSVPNQV
jgi:polysaccharide chain length determinant protein (PEP-CTERM system associated)